MGSYVISLLLLKLSKHIALLISFLILGRMYYQYDVSQLTILALTVASALLHFWSRTLRCRAIRNQLSGNRRR